MQVLSHLIAKRECSLFNRMEWFTVSNAADMSSNKRRTQRLSSIERRILFCIRTRAVSQLWCSLYADCKHSWRPFLCKWSRTRTDTTFSIDFDMNCKFDTGRKLGYSSWSNEGFFSKGDNTACFKEVGTVLQMTSWWFVWCKLFFFTVRNWYKNVKSTDLLIISEIKWTFHLCGAVLTS